jgi:uncharacterized protein Yka (UPF0111/DUF47 family)
MPNINNETLVVAIQSVAAEIRALREAAASGEAEPEEYELLEERLRAAENLEEAYKQLSVSTLNLPQYSELISG